MRMQFHVCCFRVVLLGVLGNNSYILLIIILRNSKNFNFCYGPKFPNGYSLLLIIGWPLPRTNIPAREHLLIIISAQTY